MLVTVLVLALVVLCNEPYMYFIPAIGVEYHPPRKKSLNKKNVGFISENSFKKMKKNVLFINPARGKLVNEKHLIHFLEENSEAFAFLDVFEQEPLSFEKFAHLKNVKLSSHIAGVFNKLDQSIIDFETDILRSYREAYQKNEIPSLLEGPFKNLLLKNKIHNNFMT